MFSIFEKFLDMQRELRLGITWMVLATLLIGADTYTIARFDRSLPTVLAQADVLAAVRYSFGAILTEGLFALTALVLAWFYVIPTLAFVWRQLILIFYSQLPASLTIDRPYPSASKGWTLISSARVRAIEEDNAVLFSACERRSAETKAHELVRRCVLAILVLSLLAMCESTPASGPSLMLAACFWIDELPKLYALPVLLMILPALALAWTVLVDHADFDDHIQLSAPSADRRRAG